jgi:hypothetical protein
MDLEQSALKSQCEDDEEPKQGMLFGSIMDFSVLKLFCTRCDYLKLSNVLKCSNLSVKLVLIDLNDVGLKVQVVDTCSCIGQLLMYCTRVCEAILRALLLEEKPVSYRQSKFYLKIIIASIYPNC